MVATGLTRGDVRQARERLAGVTWECKATRWSKSVRLDRHGRIGNQMRGVVLGTQGRIYLYSVDQLVGYVSAAGEVFITTKRFQLPQHILDARQYVGRNGHPLRNVPTYSMTTEQHKTWFARELASVGPVRHVEDEELRRLVVQVPREANFGRESRYGV